MQVRATRDLYDSRCVLRRAGEVFDYDGDPAAIVPGVTPFVDAREPVIPADDDADPSAPPLWTTEGHRAAQQQSKA